MPAEHLPATVVVPTIGRATRLRKTLDAILATDPGPAEVVVVDQSRAGVANDVVASRGDQRLSVVEDARRGVGRARNVGARAASHDLLLFLDDDCHPDTDWLAVASRLHREDPDALFTGTVRPGPGSGQVPSARTDPVPVDYTGTVECAVLYPNNMLVSRTLLLEFGGFDERFVISGGEDNDLCYRWLRAGRTLRYEPALVVTHENWRSPGDLEDVRRGYATAQGMFYAKHLRRRDWRMLRFLASDVRVAVRSWLGREVPEPPGAPHISGELRSIAGNWRRFRPSSDPAIPGA